MGTQILHSKRYSTGYCSIWGPNAIVSNDIWSVYHEDKAPKNGQYGDSLLSGQVTVNGSIEYNKEKVRQTILKHESMFRHQLQELHRLYGRQKELMDIFRRRDVKKCQMKAETLNLSPFSSYIPCDNAKSTQHAAHTPMRLLFGQSSISESAAKKSLSGFSKDKNMLAFPSGWDGSSEICEPPHSNGNLLQRRMIDLESPPDVDMNHEERHFKERLSGFKCNSATGGPSTNEDLHDRDIKSFHFSVLSFHQDSDALRSSLHLKRKNELADLNEPILLEDTSISGSADNLGTSTCTSDDRQGANLSAISNSILHPLRTEPMRPDAPSLMKDGSPTSSPVAFQSSPAELRKINEFSTSEIRKTERKTKRKLFGVDIFKMHDESLVTHTNMVNGTDKYDQLSSKPSVVEVKESVDSGRRSSFSSSIDGVFYQNGLFFCPHLNAKESKGNSAIDCNFVNSTTTSALVHKISPPTDHVNSVEGLDCLGWRSAEVIKTAKITSNAFQDDVAPEHYNLSADCQSEQNALKGSKVHLMETQYSYEQSRANNNSYHLNLDSLQHNSQRFFKKTKVISPSSQILIDKRETTLPLLIHENEQKNTEVEECSSTKMNSNFLTSNELGISNYPNFPTEPAFLAADGDNDRDSVVEKVGPVDQAGENDLKSEKPVKNSFSSLRCHIDLNLSVTEEEAPSAPCLPSAVVKPATTDMDLEVPLVLAYESDKGTKMSSDGGKEPCEDLIRLAAEAIVAISASGGEDTAEDATFISLEETSNDCLEWFVDIVSSFECHDQSNTSAVNLSGDAAFTEDLIPAGMDHFEFMTLKLKDAKSENYLYNYEAPVLQNQDDEEHVTTLSRRPRRGQARRGRQCKDFQRDILPSLISLSKLEVTEDFQTFEEMLRASGCNWESSLSRKSAAKNGRGRRRSGVMRSQKPDAIYPPLEQKPISRVVKLEDRTLTGWGKKTRRLPRQRSTNGPTALSLDH